MIWQTIIAYAAVALAFLWVVRHSIRTIRAGLKKGGSVSSCAGCTMKQQPGKSLKVRPLIQLNAPQRQHPEQ